MAKKRQQRGSVSMSAEGMVLLDKVRAHPEFSSVQWHEDATPGSRSACFEHMLRATAQRLGITVAPEEVAQHIAAREERRANGQAELEANPITANVDAFAPRFTG